MDSSNLTNMFPDYHIVTRYAELGSSDSCIMAERYAEMGFIFHGDAAGDNRPVQLVSQQVPLVSG